MDTNLKPRPKQTLIEIDQQINAARQKQKMVQLELEIKSNAQNALDDGYTAKYGLLHYRGVQVGLPAADRVAVEYGFMYVERLVKALEALK